MCCIGLEEEDILGHLTLTSQSGRATSNSMSAIGSVCSSFFLYLFNKYLSQSYVQQ